MKLENLLALDYPAESFSILVASDASTDGMDELVEAAAEREPRIRLLACPRGGKLAAMNRAVPETDTRDRRLHRRERDLGARRAAQARPQLRRPGRGLRVRRSSACSRRTARTAKASTGATRCGCAAASRRSARSPAATARSTRCAAPTTSRTASATTWACPTRWSSAAAAPSSRSEALAWEQPPPDLEDEYGRKVRMFPWAWQHLLEGGMLSGVTPTYLVELISHRLLRYGSGVLHVALFLTSVVLAPQGGPYALALAGQLAWLGLAAAGRLGLPGPARRPRLLLRARHLGDAGLARALPALRRAARLGEGRRHR